MFNNLLDLNLQHDISADSELTISGLPDDSELHLGDFIPEISQDKKNKNNVDGSLFQSEVSIVEESESRR